ncbi:CU044_5270 family protein [Arthrobacter sp. ISL-48]|uniref:CU044_5270 family protein n=1 Tax=Arthrobacter sp. ISL-48 TaxID=2819110 RepID=UPI001BEA313D|nr:CU044_5270 family protein [Arthrobacter sp. ISL-48]MBT2530725.1 CU044_5270 family protein [Arthrobacter sp. ISL-48]
MSKTNTSGGIGRLLSAVDPADSVSESELAKSRARSLSFLNSDAESKVDSASHLDLVTPLHTSFKANPMRIRRRIVMGSAAAAFLVGVIVAADVIMPDRPGATAEAAEFLNDAAAATIRTSDPVVGPGQYLKIETTAVYGASTDAADGSHASWLEKTGSQVYIPADRDGEWFWNREDSVPFQFSSEAAKAAEAEIRKARPEGRSPYEDQRALKGAFYGNEPTVIIGTPLSEAGSLPRDPRALLDLIFERTKGAGKSPEMEAFVTIADGLRTGVVPADLRAALYKAAALITGVIVADKQATVDGRTGIAIGMDIPGGGSRQDIIIDPTSGLVIGERDILVKDYPGEPAGTVMSWTSVRTSVVDSAP